MSNSSYGNKSLVDWCRSITREVKADTGVLLNDTAAIKQDTAEILAEIARLRAQLPADSGDQHPNILLERYLDDLTSYAETVYSDEIGIFPESEGYEQTFIDARETPGSGAGPKSNNSTPHSRSPPRSTTPPMTDIPSLVVSEDTGRNEQIRRAGLPRKEVAQYTYQLPLREPLTRPERSPPTWAQGSSSKSTAASPSERITTSTTHQVIGDRRSDNDKRSLEIGEASGAAVASNVSSSKRRTQLSTSTGTWRLGKTIGGGPNAKVKLARNEETSEQVL